MGADHDDPDLWIDGGYIDGERIGLRHNTFVNPRDGNEDVGVFVLGERNRLIGNSFDGFAVPIWDESDNTVLPRPFQP